MFDNKEQPNKPLGKLITGDLKGQDKWPMIHVAGGQSYYKTSMIMVYRKKWSLWKLKTEKSPSRDSNEELWDQPILDQQEEEGDMDNAGALINLDVKWSRYAKIKGSEVCELQITGNMSVWTNKCRPVDEDDEKFPAYTYAAIRARDKNWYYLTKDGKYCKRGEFKRKKVRTNILWQIFTISHTFSAKNGVIMKNCLDVIPMTSVLI